MVKISRQDILKELARKDEEKERKNYTFSLPRKLMEQFRDDCSKLNRSQAEILEELIRRYLES